MTHRGGSYYIENIINEVENNNAKYEMNHCHFSSSPLLSFVVVWWRWKVVSLGSGCGMGCHCKCKGETAESNNSNEWLTNTQKKCQGTIASPFPEGHSFYFVCGMAESGPSRFNMRYQQWCGQCIQVLWENLMKKVKMKITIFLTSYSHHLFLSIVAEESQHWYLQPQSGGQDIINGVGSEWVFCQKIMCENVNVKQEKNIFLTSSGGISRLCLGAGQ